MKQHFFTLGFLSLGFAAFAQNVGIGTSTPDASAKLEINSTNSGLLIPKVALVAVNNGTTPVASPATGVLVFNTNAAVTGGSGTGFYYWDSSTWRKLASGGSGSNDITSGTTGVSITNGTGQVVGGSNVVVNVATNSSTSPGLVTSGAGQNTQVWGTDAAGNPSWRSPNTMLTRNNVSTSTTGITIGNGTNQVVGGAGLTIDVATNSSTSPGLVASGAGQNTRVWGTDAAGNPAWRTPSSMFTLRDITTATTGVTVSNGTGQVIGASNVSVDVAMNSSTSPGLVASGAGQSTKVWGTTAAGVPGWVEAASIIDVQNGLNINTTAPASAANPYVELGGTLIRHTTITQGAFNMLYDQTGAGIFRINHVNTTAATMGSYPFAISRAGATNYTIGADASFVYNQTWASKPLLINSQGNFVGINTTTTPIQNLDINGRMNVANGVIQRGTSQITGTTDLGLYSQIGGNWIRIATNAAPIKFFVDQGGTTGVGTNALVNMDNANGGGVAIGAITTGATNPSPNARAVLDLQSTEKGMLTPRLTTAQRDAMPNNLPEGLLIYNTTNNCFEFWDTKATPNGGNGFWNSLCQWCQNVVIISGNQTGFNLNSYLGGARAEQYCVFIAAGVTLQASGNGGGNGAAGNPGFNASTMPAGATITLYNYGTILAGGGNGGRGGTEVDGVCAGSDTNGQQGGTGGNAIQTNASVPIVCYNYGTVRAGGGGGGGGGYGCCSAGGGGGGGAGTPVGTGGGGNTSNCISGGICGCNSTSSAAGNPGTALVGGTGVAGANRPATGCPTCNGRNAGTGGNGGNPGIGGTAGTAPEGNGTMGAAGGAGLALQGNNSGSSLTNLGAGASTGGVNP